MTSAAATDRTLGHPWLKPWATAAIVTAILAVIAVIGAPGLYKWALGVSALATAIVVAVVDVRTKRIPNRFVVPFGAATATQVIIMATMTRSGSPVVTALAAFGATLLCYLVMGMLGWLGMGDVKFAPLLAAAVSLEASVSAVTFPLCAILAAGATALIARIGGRAAGPQAHGPALAAAAAAVLLASALA